MMMMPEKHHSSQAAALSPCHYLPKARGLQPAKACFRNKM
jgi:hypothetical protein